MNNDISHDWVVSMDDPDRSLKLAVLCAQLAYNNRAHDISVLHIGEICSFADFFVIASGVSTALSRAVGADCERALKASQVTKLGGEGGEAGGWYLLDFGDVVIQIFDQEARQFYQLDELWGDAPSIDWEKASCDFGFSTRNLTEREIDVQN